MPGWAFPGFRRPAGEALSRNLPCDGWYARDVARRGNGGLVCAGGGVGCRGIRSGVGANASPGTGITCNHTAGCRGGAKSWPYRPRGLPGWCPGIASRAGGAGLTGRNRKGARVCRRTFHVMRVSASNVTTRRVAANLVFGALCVSGLRAIPVLVHSRRCCVCGL
jgi:hypothetical protein